MQILSIIQWRRVCTARGSPSLPPLYFHRSKNTTYYTVTCEHIYILITYSVRSVRSVIRYGLTVTTKSAVMMYCILYTKKPCLILLIKLMTSVLCIWGKNFIEEKCLEIFESTCRRVRKNMKILSVKHYTFPL